MHRFSAFIRQTFLISIFFFVVFDKNLVAGKKYEDRHQELVTAMKAKGKNPKWTVKVNPAFVGKDANYMKSVLGIKGEQVAKNIGRARKAQKRPPKDGRMKGKGKQQAGKSAGGQQGQGGRGGKGRSADHFRRLKRQSALPTNFDWRDYTPCQSFKNIRYQTCGDCWAVSSAAVISDRYCLYTQINRYFSARALAACVYGVDGGCDGGWPQDAMKYYLEKGLSSGGDWSASEARGCLAYPRSMRASMTCPVSCDNGPPLDLLYAGDYETITSQDVGEIQQQIYTYGSAVAIFEVFEDFYSLGTGVYEYTYGDSVGWHAVKILGYGEENGTPYWLCANQWGTDWGDKGFFKILRGSNHVGIETAITAVYPKEAWA